MDDFLVGPRAPHDRHPRSAARHSAPSGLLRVSSHADGPGRVLVLVGELDIASAPVLTDHVGRLGASCPAYLVADLSGLGFCDCAGLAALLRIHHRAVESGGWLRLCAVGAVTHKVLSITGLSQVLLCYPGVTQAFADLPGIVPVQAGATAVADPAGPAVPVPSAIAAEGGHWTDRG
ncbi:anti-anti-sigma factor [Catenulispora sp. GP43]